MISYMHPLLDLEALTGSILAQGYIPVIWNKSRGLQIRHLSKQFPLFEDANTAHLQEPYEILEFIIKRPQERVAYILEDFHHYIGEKHVVNPQCGEIRSLIKEMYRSLLGRGDRVYLFIPKDYELPQELYTLFTNPAMDCLSQYHVLDQFGIRLTDKSYLSRLKPVLYMDQEIFRLMQILSQMETNNPLLVGHPGVGKTAIVEGLARLILSDKVPQHIKNKEVFALSVNRLVSGTRYRGDFEQRLETLMNAVLQHRDHIIVFIDEIHTLLNAGSSEGSFGAGDILKPLLSRGEFPCIGATTYEGETYLSKDPAFMRRFKKINIQPCSIAKTIEILEGIKSRFEKHHQVIINEDAIKSAVFLSDKYLKQSYLPGKAIALLDSTCAYCHLQGKREVKSEAVLWELNVASEE